MWAMPYAYLGPEGTFSEAALRAADPPAEPLPSPTIQAALGCVRDGTAERAVVPIESSVEGVVTATLDDLAAGNDLVIVAELQIPIAFALLATPGTAVGDIKRVGGHPQAMPQCRGWLAAHLPDCEWVPLASNAVAARQAADGQVDAALAGAFAAERYGLAVLVPDVHDRANAVTRFVVVSPPRPLPARTGADRTSLAAFLTEDHPGALLEILTEFAVRGINLTTIQSRPTGDRLGQYYFFIDCEGHVDDARVGEALMGLRRVCQDVRFLGSYARCDGTATAIRPGTSDSEFAEAAAWLGRLRFGRPLSPRPGPPPGRSKFSWRRHHDRSEEKVLKVRAGRGALLCFLIRGYHPGRQGAAHLLELGASRHLLGEQRGLDAVEQAFQPAHQLGLGNPQLAIAGHPARLERQRQPLELIDKLGREAVLQLLDGALVDLFQPDPALLVKRRRPDLLEQLPDHVADPHDLGRLLDHLGDRALAAGVLVLLAGRRRYAARAHHEDLRVLL